MAKKYYRKQIPGNKKRIVKIISGIFFISGATIAIYIFWPLLSWQIFFAPAFANQSIAIPIPKTTMVTGKLIDDLLSQASSTLSNQDFTDAKNWFPTYQFNKPTSFNKDYYYLSIPKLNIDNVLATGKDYDLKKHLVNYAGTALPGENGNAVIFGHSSLPQLSLGNMYKTVFTYLYQLVPGDQIIIDRDNKTYKYKVESITVIEPEDTTVFEQDYSDSFISLVTCTPPGTIWKRLVVKARMEK